MLQRDCPARQITTAGRALWIGEGKFIERCLMCDGLATILIHTTLCKVPGAAVPPDDEIAIPPRGVGDLEWPREQGFRTQQSVRQQQSKEVLVTHHGRLVGLIQGRPGAHPAGPSRPPCNARTLCRGILCPAIYRHSFSRRGGNLSGSGPAGI